MVGVLEPAEIDDLLAGQKVARLGCHAEGTTYVVPISYAYVDGLIIGQTTSGMKIDMMRANPDVCLEVDEIQSLTDWQSAIVWGRFEELEGMAAVEAMDKLIDRFGPIFEEAYSRNRLGRSIAPDRPNQSPAPAIVYAIHIMQKTGRFERPDA